MEGENPLENIQLPEQTGDEKKKGKKKGPTLTTQVKMILGRLEQQAQRTDKLYHLIRKPKDSPEKEGQHDKVVGPSFNYSHSPPARKHVVGSRVKRTSPRNGRSRKRYVSKSSCQSEINISSCSSSPSDGDEVGTQVRRAVEMLNPRFTEVTVQKVKTGLGTTVHLIFSRGSFKGR